MAHFKFVWFLCQVQIKVFPWERGFVPEEKDVVIPSACVTSNRAKVHFKICLNPSASHVQQGEDVLDALAHSTWDDQETRPRAHHLFFSGQAGAGGIRSVDSRRDWFPYRPSCH